MSPVFFWSRSAASSRSGSGRSLATRCRFRHLLPSDTPVTAAAVAEYSYHQLTYSFLLRYGWPAFVGALAIGTGVGGAAFAVAGVTALLVVRNRILALAAPFLISFLETLVAALAGHPEYGLQYSFFPTGLATQLPLVGLAPMGLFTLATAGAVAILLVRAPTLERLS